MKMLNHFIYMQKFECEMQSVVVWSLNHDTTMSFDGLHLIPIFHCPCNFQDVFGSPDLEKPGEFMQHVVDGGPVHRVKLEMGKDPLITVEYTCQLMVGPKSDLTS
jgi:hypothetical protein